LETKEIQQTLVKVFGLGSLGLSSELLDKVMLHIKEVLERICCDYCHSAYGILDPCTKTNLNPNQVCSIIRPRKFKRGDHMFTAGAKAKEVILLTSGSCCLQRVVHHSTKVSTSDGSTPILSRSHAPRKQNAVVANLQAPSIVGLPFRKDGTTGADIHVLGAVALTEAVGLVLSFGDMDEIEALKKVFAHVQVMAAKQESSISGNSGAVERTFWHKGAVSLSQSPGSSAPFVMRLNIRNLVIMHEFSILSLNLMHPNPLRSRRQQATKRLPDRRMTTFWLQAFSPAQRRKERMKKMKSKVGTCTSREER